MKKFKEIFFVQEERKWVRIVESAFTLLPAYLAGVLFISASELLAADGAQNASLAGLIFSPIVAVLMYRKSALYQFERLSILVLILFYSLMMLRL